VIVFIPEVVYSEYRSRQWLELECLYLYSQRMRKTRRNAPLMYVEKKKPGKERIGYSARERCF